MAIKKGKREVALDTETTGLDAKKDRVIELACVEMFDRVPSGRVMNVLINPGLDDEGNPIHIGEEVTRIHGRTDDDVKDKPTFDGYLKEFEDFIEDSPLVIHNAPFDMGFLNASKERACKQLGIPYQPINNKIVDTLVLARKQRPRAQNSIDALCRHFKIDLSSRVKHEALIDTKLLVRVYQRLYEVNGSLDLFSAAQKTVTFVDRPFREPRAIETMSETEWVEHTEYMASIKNNIWNKIFNEIEGKIVEKGEEEVAVAYDMSILNRNDEVEEDENADTTVILDDEDAEDAIM